uniref:Uncharacterized protein n=1 Tax=Ammonifex degensii TaxID=42838 RepID=A0A7C1F3C4_9THEO
MALGTTESEIVAIRAVLAVGRRRVAVHIDVTAERLLMTSLTMIFVAIVAVGRVDERRNVEVGR